MMDCWGWGGDYPTKERIDGINKEWGLTSITTFLGANLFVTQYPVVPMRTGRMIEDGMTVIYVPQ